jgi:hypothetical protein
MSRTLRAVASKNVEMIRAYYAASSDMDWQAAGRCVGPGYVWIDHATGVEARSPEDLQ